MSATRTSRDLHRPALELPRRYRRNVATEYGRTMIFALTALVTTPILVRHLGTERYGIWVLVGSIALYLELLEFGFGTATVKYVAECAGRNDIDGVRKTVATSFWVLSAPGGLALLIGGAVTAVFPRIFHLHADLATAARILLLLVLFDLAVSIPGDTFGGTLIGLQRYDMLNATMVVVTLAQAASWWLVLSHGGGLVALGAVTVAISLTGQFSRYLIVRRYVPGLSVSPRYFDRTLAGSLGRLSAWYAVIDLSKIVVARLDVVVVGVVVGVPAAGIYAVGQKLAFAAEQVVMPVTKAFLPHASELAVRNDTERLRATIVAGTRMSFAVAGPLCLALALLAKPTLGAWLGGGFGEAGVVVVCLAASTAIAAISRPGFLMLQGVGAPRVPAAIVSGEAVANLTLSVVLGHLIGLQGVAIATLVAGSISHLGFLLPAICRRFGVSVRHLLLEVARAHAPAAAVGSGVGVGLLHLGIHGIPEVLGAGTLIAGMYALTFAFTGMNRSERRTVRRLVLRRAALERS